VVEPSAWACWEGILIENLKKIKKQELTYYQVMSKKLRKFQR
jgi:hypothetical protein